MNIHAWNYARYSKANFPAKWPSFGYHFATISYILFYDYFVEKSINFYSYDNSCRELGTILEGQFFGEMAFIATVRSLLVEVCNRFCRLEGVRLD